MKNCDKCNGVGKLTVSDTERLDWVLDKLRLVGSAGLAKSLHYGLHGPYREDIDTAIDKKY